MILKRMSKTLRGLVVIGGVLMALVMVGLLAHGSRSRTTLQAYKAQLRAKGEKLTLSELKPDAHANINNSLALLNNAVTKLGNARFFPGSLGLMTFIGAGKARLARTADQPPFYSRVPGNPVEWTEFVAGFEKAEPALEEIRQAMEDPALDWGLGTNLPVGPTSNFYVPMQRAAQWLAGAEVKELHEGNVERAVQNLEALLGLAQMNREEYARVAQMIRLRITRNAVAATWEALQAPGWSDSQLERLQKSWQRIDLIDGLERGLVGERAFGEAACSEARHADSPRTSQAFLPPGTSQTTKISPALVMQDRLLLPAWRLTSANDDELFFLKMMQAGLETTRSLETSRSWNTVKQTLDELTDHVERTAGAWQGFRYPLSARSIPNFLKAAEAALRGETERQLALAAIALKRSQLARGAFPATLDDLVPEFLPSIPRDFMNGKPLHYRLLSDGSFLLYSVGDDGRDDGGDASAVSPGRFGLWEGRDAVWPSAAHE